MRLNTAALGQSVQRRAARAIDVLPPSVATRLGGGPVEVDGQVLHPTLVLGLRARERMKAPRDELSVEQQREIMRTNAAMAAGVPIPVGTVRDLTVDGAAGPLRARHYAPPSGARRPLLVFLHGGGWVVGDLDTHDQPCRLLARFADVHVLSVDYRLAPEHPFPAAVDDSVAAFGWAV